MTPRTASANGRRRAFSLLEVQAAFIILGFSMAAIFPFAVAQIKLVAALEQRLPPNTTFVLVSRDNHLLALLAAGGGTTALPSSATSTGTSPEDIGPSSRVLVIQSVVPGSGTNEVTATVTVEPKSSGG
jgi:hypothetical protein